ncbi:MAG TPA: MAPEG family protein [Steroidobacteraceae bacterium]
MIAIPRYTPLVTLLAVGYYFFLATRVARARIKFHVELPATSGHPVFDRIFRVHVNTLEWTLTFLVPLWLCAAYLNDLTAAALGLVWIIGRVWYFAGYSKSVRGRLPGFFVQSSACGLLFIGAGAGVIVHLVGH